MQVDDKLIRYLEELSYIALSDEERGDMISSVQRVLDKMSGLKELNTEGVLELTHPIDNVNVFRDDVVEASLDRSLLLKNARQKNEEMFIVPKTVE